MRVTAETKHQTDRAIRDAAKRLFAEKGFGATSTREIAQEAGIATGTLFNYYPSKESLALDLVAEALEIGNAAYLHRMQTRPAGSAAEELFALIATGLRALEPARSSVAQVLDAGLSPFSSAAHGSPAERIRTRQLELAVAALARHGHAAASPVSMHLYWTLYLGILAYWAGDASPGRQETLALIDQSLRLFVEALRPRDSIPASLPEAIP